MAYGEKTSGSDPLTSPAPANMFVTILNAVLIGVMLSEALPDPPTLMMEAGKCYDKRGNPNFLLNTVMPHFRFQW